MNDKQAITPNRPAYANKIAPRVNILMVEDNPDHATLAKVALETNKSWSIDVVGNLATAFSAIRTNDYQVLLVDYRLPDGDGLDLLDWVEPGCAVILMTSQGSEQLAVEALKYGALDYVVKDSLFRDVITDVVQNALERAHNNRRTANDSVPGQSAPRNSRSLPDKTGAKAVSENDSCNPLTIHHTQSIRETAQTMLDNKTPSAETSQQQALRSILDHCDALLKLLTNK